VIALAGLIVGGGLIVSRWGFSAGWIAETALCALGGAIAFAMVEPPGLATEPEDDSPEPRAGIPWRAAAVVILPLAFLDAATSAGSFILQTSGAGGASEVTLIVAIITLADAAGSTFASHMSVTAAA